MADLKGLTEFERLSLKYAGLTMLEALRRLERLEKVEAAARKLPLWTPEIRLTEEGKPAAEPGNHDPLYGPPPKYIPCALLVDAEKLVELRAALEPQGGEDR